jgi:tripartite-type tricarboxylate transporter receptor subunit TctC
VPYKGASQGLTDLAGGHIVFSAQTLSSTAGLVRGGQLRAIAHSHSSRLPDFPDVPTLKESGYDVVATTWFSISGRPTCPRTSPTRSTARSRAPFPIRRRRRGSSGTG